MVDMIELGGMVEKIGMAEMVDLRSGLCCLLATTPGRESSSSDHHLNMKTQSVFVRRKEI